jgi:hypothetical protein
MTKNWNSTSSDWTKIYSGSVWPNQLTISTDGSHLYFLMQITSMTMYKMDGSNGDLLNKYVFSGISYDNDLSRIAFNSGTIFVSGTISGNG